jgi:hypothetical protein
LPIIKTDRSKLPSPDHSNQATSPSPSPLVSPSPSRNKNNFHERKKSDFSVHTPINYFSGEKKSGRNLLGVIDLKNMAKDREVKTTDIPSGSII